MNFMFCGTEAGRYYPSIFNQAIEKWDVGNVIEMYAMFEYAPFFNQPLDNWNVQSLNNPSRMFNYAYEFNQCLATWAEKTMSNAVNTTAMFDMTSCPCLDDEDFDSSGECVDPDGPWCQAADICPGSASPSLSPTASPVELTCKDNKKVKFLIPKKKDKFKKTKCKKLKEKDCDKEYDLQKKVDGVKNGKPKDFCVCTCNPKECLKDDPANDFRILSKDKKPVKGKFSCLKIKEEGYCKGKVKTTGEKLKNVCKLSCGKC